MKKGVLTMAIERRIEFDGTYMPVIEFGRGSRTALMFAGASLCGIEGLGGAIEAAYSCMHDEFHFFCFDTKKRLPPTSTVDEMTSDAIRCLEILGISDADVMGASHGGMIAMNLALERPQMVRSLAICGSSSAVEGEAAKTITRWRDLAKKKDIAGLGAAFFEDLFSNEFKHAHEELRGAYAAKGTDDDCEHFVTVMGSVLGVKLRERLSEIKCRALVLGADDDRVLGVDASGVIARGIGCPLHIYPGLGHAFYDETADAPLRIRDHFLAS